MAHSHTHHPGNDQRALALAIALNFGFVLVEAVFGIRAHALALVADAGHNLSDVLGLALAWTAMTVATRAPTSRRTYGMRRATILAALINAVLLYIAVGAIAWEALHRLRAFGAVDADTVMAVALVGIVINGLSAWRLHRGHGHDLNVRGAFLHLVADMAVSLGVVLAGAAIRLTGWMWLDPAASLAISALVVVGSWGLLREALHLAMDGVPAGIDPAEVAGYLRRLPGITDVHDLHIWGMSTTEPALTAHLVRPGRSPDADLLIADASTALHDRFGISHVTLQIERDPAVATCRACGDGAGNPTSGGAS